MKYNNPTDFPFISLISFGAVCYWLFAANSENKLHVESCPFWSHRDTSLSNKSRLPTSGLLTSLERWIHETYFGIPSHCNQVLSHPREKFALHYYLLWCIPVGSCGKKMPNSDTTCYGFPNVFERKVGRQTFCKPYKEEIACYNNHRNGDIVNCWGITEFSVSKIDSANGISKQ